MHMHVVNVSDGDAETLAALLTTVFHRGCNSSFLQCIASDTLYTFVNLVPFICIDENPHRAIRSVCLTTIAALLWDGSDLPLGFAQRARDSNRLYFLLPVR